MSENIELSYVWDHTIIKLLNHDIQSKIGNMIKEWVVFNKLEDFNSLLEYTDDDFTPTGNLCYINQNGEKKYRKLLKEFSTSDGLFNILLMNMNINMVIMSGPILYMKAIGSTEQTSNS